MCVDTINKLTINKDDNMYIHTAPVLKVAQLYRKLIASFIGITAEGINYHLAKNELNCS